MRRRDRRSPRRAPALGPPGAPAPSPTMAGNRSEQHARQGSRPALSHPIVPVAALASSSRFARRCTIGTRRFWARVSALIDDYNARRWHSALGMMSPVDYERAFKAGEAA
jgi:hypothetical protein